MNLCASERFVIVHSINQKTFNCVGWGMLGMEVGEGIKVDVVMS